MIQANPPSTPLPTRSDRSSSGRSWREREGHKIRDTCTGWNANVETRRGEADRAHLFQQLKQEATCKQREQGTNDLKQRCLFVFTASKRRPEFMGNASCSRRMQQNSAQAPPPGYPNAQVAPVGQIPHYYHVGENSSIAPEARRQSYPQAFWPSNGQYFMNVRSGAVNPVLSQEAVVPSSWSPPVTEQKVVPIRNEVNVNKSTLHLEKDKENPGYYLVAFTFDAIVSGSICIFFHAKEGQDFSLIPMKRELFEPVRIPFEKGLAQKFVQAPGTGVSFLAFEPSDLLQVKDGEIYPLVVRAESCGGGDSSGRDDAQEVGAPLMKSVGAQTTSCVLDIKDNDYCVRVIKQIIWVEGVRYELQEIYGIESVDGGGGLDSSDFGKECVICLSEQRDTTVLPCRHMCMCSGCAKLLQQRTNRCPICRTPVVKLLEIEIPKRETVST